MDLTRRRLLGLGIAAGGVATLAACSATRTTTGAAEAGGGAGSEWRTVSVEHAYGTTTIPKRPTRVVTVGVTEQDFVLALGTKPVGVTDWYGDQPYAMWPWARDANGDNKPVVLNTDDGFQFAKIAQLRPDLVVGPNSGMTEDDYGTLSRIAPTIAQASTDQGYFAPWTDMFTTIGTALGKADEAAAATKAIERRFAAAAADHPAFAGKQVVFLQNAVSDGNLIASQKGLGTEFLTDLGFDIPTEIDQFVREGEQAYIPVERINLLDAADVLVWGTEQDGDRTELEKVPGFKDLTAVKAGRSVYTGGELAGAIYFSSPLSLPYIVDRLVPMLSDAV